ncbi:MAG: 3-hydroxyacyl-ACP dehydratase FabZ [Oligoflexales bacterium]|nr:3-hydroxyacyl-ACP dehydratase FabZ [Oligoflexales bacterium]
MGLLEEQLPLSVIQIQKYIPHRFPFLFVDRITELRLKPDWYIEGYKNISANEPILQGHFPTNPIFPGVVILEGMAQTAAILGRAVVGEECSTCMLTEVQEARFRRPVVPGDMLVYKIKGLRERKSFFWFEGDVYVNDESIGKAKFSAMLK